MKSAVKAKGAAKAKGVVKARDAAKGTGVAKTKRAAKGTGVAKTKRAAQGKSAAKTKGVAPSPTSPNRSRAQARSQAQSQTRSQTRSQSGSRARSQSLVGDIVAAFMLLSRIPMGWYRFRAQSGPDFTPAQWAFPLVGLVIGAAGGGVLVGLIEIRASRASKGRQRGALPRDDDDAQRRHARGRACRHGGRFWRRRCGLAYAHHA